MAVPAASIYGMGEPKILAGIVTFNPDLARLRENLEAVRGQVDGVVIIDNASNNAEEVLALTSNDRMVDVVNNPTNYGIARALNQAMTWALQRRAKAILLLDQDSVLSPPAVQRLSANFGPGVAVVAPAIKDRNNSATHLLPTAREEVDYCITSGSLCDIQAWLEIGGYDESLFIDFVDFDYCLRLRQHGYRIVRDGSAVLLHEIGKITKHGPFTAYHHSAFRLRHMARDMLYYAHKHRHASPELKVRHRGVPATYAVLARKVLIVGLFEEDKARKISALFRGAVAGTGRLKVDQGAGVAGMRRP